VSRPDLIGSTGNWKQGPDLMLRKLILGTSSWALLGVAASAADLPAVMKAPPATAQSWAGFYLGVHGGYGWGENSFRTYLVETDPHIFSMASGRRVPWLARTPATIGNTAAR
jgi:opacity protein-like surface antigen